MIRRAIAVVFTATVVMLAFASLPAQMPQIRLARQPDYHAGRIAFTYLGDIWTASETGSDPERLTDHRGHDMSPKFSPDGRWIAFASNRYGNNDRDRYGNNSRYGSSNRYNTVSIDRDRDGTPDRYDRFPTDSRRR